MDLCLDQTDLAASISEKLVRSLAIDNRLDFDGSLYHVTPFENLPAIRGGGVRAGCGWCVQSLVSHFEGAFLRSGKAPAVIRVRLVDFDLGLFTPDKKSIVEPLADAILMDADEAIRAWRDSDKTWLDSLRIAGSVCYDGTIHLSEAVIGG